MKALAKLVIVAGLPLLVSHFVRPMSIRTYLEDLSAATASRPPTLSVKPTGNAAPDSYSGKFPKTIQGGSLELKQADQLTEIAERNLKKLSDDRASAETFVTATDDSLEWARTELLREKNKRHGTAADRAIHSLKTAIGKEIKAYGALARGHFPEAYNLIADAAERQEFAYLVKYMLSYHNKWFPGSSGLSHTLDFSAHMAIQQATKNLKEQKKGYDLIPDRQQLGAVIHHFNLLGYPADKLLLGSGLVRDRLGSRVFGESAWKSNLEADFKTAAMAAQTKGKVAIESLEKNDRIKAMQSIKELLASRNVASGVHLRYQQDGHGVIDLRNFPELKNAQSRTQNKLQNVLGTSQKIPKLTARKLMKILAIINRS